MRKKKILGAEQPQQQRQAQIDWNQRKIPPLICVDISSSSSRGGQHLFTVYFISFYFPFFLFFTFLFIWSSNLRQRIGKIKNPPKAITDKKEGRRGKLLH